MRHDFSQTNPSSSAAGSPGRLRKILSRLPGASHVAALGFFVRDKNVPIRQRATVAVALVYLLSPLDIVPEVLLGPLGLADDAAVAAMLVKFLFSNTLKPYRDQARRWLRGDRP